MILPRKFYAREPEIVARDLIGKRLVRNLSEEGETKKLGGIIVECEAYGGFDDPASHAFRGRTKRNEAMFGDAGHAYIYFTYGFHHCLNFVTGSPGVPSAVLIRAFEPLFGVERMKKSRDVPDLKDISNGPGKLCEALSIDLGLNKVDITKRGAAVMVIGGIQKRDFEIKSSSRVGIVRGKEKRWRFYASGSKFVSKTPEGQD